MVSGRKALRHRLLGHPEAERAHPVADVEQDAPLARRPGFVPDPAVVAEEAFRAVAEAVGHHVAGAQVGQLLAQRPVLGAPGAEQEREPGVPGRREPLRHDDSRIGAPARRAAEVDGDAPDRARGSSLSLPNRAHAGASVHVLPHFTRAAGRRLAPPREVDGEPYPSERGPDHDVQVSRQVQGARFPLREDGRRAEGEQMDVGIHSVA